jgi:hypothetical protein
MPSRTSRYFASFKIFSTIVLLLIVLAIIYAAALSLKNWPGINV